MQKLIEGYLRFHAEVFPQREDQFRLLAQSQSPQTLLITCSDSRIVPHLLFQAGPGDMFVCRNAGNVVPPSGAAAEGTAASIEYAVDALEVKHIIICGHSNCGAVRAALRPELAVTLPLVLPWVQLVSEAQRVGAALLDASGQSQEASLRDAVCANILGQLENLRLQPSVARALASGRVAVHGWYYDIASGTVEAYHPERRSFVPLSLNRDQ